MQSTSNAFFNRISKILTQDDKTKRRQWALFGYLLTTAAIIYLAYSLFATEISVFALDWKRFGLTLLSVLGIYFVSLAVQFIAWIRIISFHRKFTARDLEIYSRMILMRRIPGGPWHWIGRSVLYSSSTALPLKVSFVGSVLEWLIVVIIGAALLLSSFSDIQILPRFGGVGLIISISIILSIIWQPPKRPLLQKTLDGLGWTFLYLVAWIASLLIFILVFQSISDVVLPLNDAQRIWYLSAEIGMILVIMPATFGVQEVSLTLLLNPFVSQPVAVLVAILIRLTYVLSDAFWGGIGWLVSRWILRK